MQPEIILQIDPSAENERGMIEKLVPEGMLKVDAYLKRFDDKPDATIRIQFFVKKNHDNTYHGKLHANVDGDIILFDRERFHNLDDLVHHAFQHMKEHLAAK